MGEIPSLVDPIFLNTKQAHTKTHNLTTLYQSVPHLNIWGWIKTYCTILYHNLGDAYP